MFPGLLRQREGRRLNSGTGRDVIKMQPEKEQTKTPGKPQSFADLYRAGMGKEELMKRFCLDDKGYGRVVASLKELGTI